MQLPPCGAVHHRCRAARLDCAPRTDKRTNGCNYPPAERFIIAAGLPHRTVYSELTNGQTDATTPLRSGSSSLQGCLPHSLFPLHPSPLLTRHSSLLAHPSLRLPTASTPSIPPSPPRPTLYAPVRSYFCTPTRRTVHQPTRPPAPHRPPA